MLSRRTRRLELEGLEKQPNGVFVALAMLDGLTTPDFERVLMEQMPCKFYLTGNEELRRPVGYLELNFIADRTYQLTGKLFASPDMEEFSQLPSHAVLCIQTRRLNEKLYSEKLERITIG